MNQERFNDVVRLAVEHLRCQSGEFRDPDPASDRDLFAYALLSAAGLGPWGAQAARLKAWADEREERFIAVRGLVEEAGITTAIGDLEDQVRVLVQRANNWRGAGAAVTPRDIAESRHPLHAGALVVKPQAWAATKFQCSRCGVEVVVTDMEAAVEDVSARRASALAGIATRAPLVVAIDESLHAAFKAGYEAGFLSSVEGHNGEYGDLAYVPGATPDPFGDRQARYDRAVVDFEREAQAAADEYLSGRDTSATIPADAPP